MAEKYGTVPKRFTSAWWTYFWDYYKWHTIASVTVILFVVVTLVQCVTREKYDVTVVYGGQGIFDEANQETMEQILSEHCDDVDENGVPNVFFMPCVLSDTPGNEEFTYAMQTKLDLSFQDEQTYLFLFDKAELDLVIQRYSFPEGVIPITDIAPDADEEKIVYAEGVPCAYNLKDSRVLLERNIKCDDLYMILTKCYKDKPLAQDAFLSSQKIAAALMHTN